MPIFFLNQMVQILDEIAMIGDEHVYIAKHEFNFLWTKIELTFKRLLYFPRNHF